MTIERALLARHGQTEWNVAGRRQGELDSPLTGQARETALRLGERLAAEGVDAIFVSPLGRAMSTSELINLRLGLPVTVLSELAEVRHGRVAGLTDSELRRRHPVLVLRRGVRRYRTPFPGGESYRDAEVRARRALEIVGASSSRVPLIVTHEMLGRMLVRALTGMPVRQALRLRLRSDVVLSISPGGAPQPISSADSPRPTPGTQA